LNQTPQQHHLRLQDWWEAFCEQRNELHNDESRFLHQFLQVMLARRLGLTDNHPVAPPLDDTSFLQRSFEQAIGYGFGFASVNTAFDSQAASLERAGQTEAATEPLPQPIEMRSVPFDPPPADTAIEALAFHAPVEYAYLRCRSPQNYLWFRRLLLDWGGSIEDVVSARARETGNRERYERQLALSPEAAVRSLPEDAVADMALLAADPNFNEGAGVGIVIQTRKLADVDRWIKSQRASAMQADKQLAEDLVRIGDHMVPLLSSPRDKRVLSYYAVDGDFVLVTNSSRLVQRFYEAGRGQRSLGLSSEFKYARSNVLVHDDQSVFLYLSDPFFRELASPHYQIELQRRRLAAADLQHLGLARLAALGEDYRFSNVDDLVAGGYLPEGFGERADGSRPILHNDEACDSLRGALGTFIPIADRKVDAATKSELNAYHRFIAGYLKEWRTMDPVAVVVAREPLPEGRERVEIDITITPYAKEKYRDLRRFLGSPNGRRIAHHVNDPLSVDAVLQIPGETMPFHAYAGVRVAKMEYEFVDGRIQLSGRNVGDTYAAQNYYLALSTRDDEALYAVLDLLNGLGIWRRSSLPLRLITDFAHFITDFPRLLISPLSNRTQRPAVVANERDGWRVISQNDDLKTPDLRFVNGAQLDGPQLRLRLKELKGTQVEPYIQAYTFLDARRTSARNATLLNTAMQQLHLPPNNVVDELENLYGTRLVCPLDGKYELVKDAAPAAYWQSTKWGVRSLYDESHPGEDYRFAFLEWLKTLDLDFKLDDQTLTAQVTLDIRPQGR
jgi:hypothetical protein